MSTDTREHKAGIYMDNGNLATASHRPQGPIWGDPCPNCGTTLVKTSGFAEANIVGCPKCNYKNNVWY